jgi:replicative DNA helicase
MKDLSKVPNSPEAEQGVLGCCLLSPHQCLFYCAEKFKAGDDVFFDPRNQLIYSTMQTLAAENQTPDVITIIERIKTRESMEGAAFHNLCAYLSDLPDAVPSSANIAYYVKIVLDNYSLRRIQGVCASVQGQVQGCDTNKVGDLLNRAESDILAIRMENQDGRGVANIRALQELNIAEYDAALTRKTPPGILTTLGDLDRKLGGLAGQDLVFVAGTPSSGKTTLLLNIAARVAQAGVRVSFHSLETSSKKLVHRLQCQLGQVDGGGFLRGEIMEGEMKKMMVGVSKLKAIRDNLMLHDDGGLDEPAFAASARRDYHDGARLFMLDYLQLLNTEGNGDTERVSNASKCCKRVAKELDCPLLVVSSLSRFKEDRRPCLADLRQSGQIEYDADKVLLLSCDDRTGKIRDVECDVAKNKDGETGSVWFTLFADQFRIEQAAHENRERKDTRENKRKDEDYYR